MGYQRTTHQLTALLATLAVAIGLLTISAAPASAAPGVHPGGGWIDLAAGNEHTCTLSAQGQVFCWGNNLVGQLGYGDTADRGNLAADMGNNLPPVDLGTGRTATALAAGNDHTCALLDDRTVKCWGFNIAGQLGYGDTADRGDDPNEMGDDLPAVDLGTGRWARALAVGSTHSCAILDDYSAKCWGSGGFGRLGQSNFATIGDDPNEMGANLMPIDLGAGRSVVALTAGEAHNCAILDNSELKCWGRNAVGQLGLGDTNDRGDGANEMGDSLPAVSLGDGRTATAVSAGQIHTCALLDNAEVKCWGQGTEGQLGYGNNWNRGDNANEMGFNLPNVPLGTDVTVVAIATGYRHSCARLADGGLKCWGENSRGQLGQSDTSDRGDNALEMQDFLLPIMLGADRTVTAVGAGAEHTCSILDDNTLRCWGYNSQGQLGLGVFGNIGDGIGEMGDFLPPVSLPTGIIFDPAGIETVVPFRLLETRAGQPTGDGLQEGIGRRTPGQVTSVDVAGRAGVDTDATAAIITLTAINPGANGHATAYPCDAPKPDASTLNYEAGQTIANSATIDLAADGTLCFFSQRSADYVVDVTGFVPFGSTVDTITPARLFESRPEEPTFDGVQQGAGRRDAGTETTIVVAGRAGIPADASAAILNIAVIGAERNGYVAAYPCGGAPSESSILNYAAGQTIANGATIAIGAGGTVCVFTQRAMDLVVDATGYHVDGASPETFEPKRFFETRPGEPTFDGQQQGVGRIEPQQVTTIQIAGRGGIPASTPAVMVNVASVIPIGPGFVRLFPCDKPQPGTSNLNHQHSQTIANNATIQLSEAGTICVYNHRQMDLILDVTGYTR
ncbi:MAG: hypothetical protein AAFY28_10015 [Actinomycetota bacterium]